MENLSQEIKTINMLLPFRLGSVNCYLVKAEAGYILVDTGVSNKCIELHKELINAGCEPDNLKLLVLTHGDFDHSGNAAYLSNKFGAKIAMHYDDSGMVERGNMFWNREKGNILQRMLTNVLFGFSKSKRFKPDIYVEDGFSFSEYGFNAKAIHIPGHSKGSIGIITTAGDLICGDLFENIDKPKLNSLMDDSETAKMSVKKLADLKVNTVYPGHGKPFEMEMFIKNWRDSFQ